MNGQSPAQAQLGYAAQLFAFIGHATMRLVRSPSHSRRALAARHGAQRTLWLVAILSVSILLLMLLIDGPEISLMPPRGTASLWPIRILTDFGKSSYVLWTLFGLLIALVLALPLARLGPRIVMVGAATRVQFLLLAVLFPVMLGEVLKGMIGRGRPFVGGAANPFNYSHFAWSEAYASFPSGHATTAFALGFGISAIWPQLRVPMLIYAVAIALTRLVLLAHHASDVVAGALLGLTGAMIVRYWFAARRVVFTIREDGSIVPLMGPWRGLL